MFRDRFISIFAIFFNSGLLRGKKSYAMKLSYATKLIWAMIFYLSQPHFFFLVTREEWKGRKRAGATDWKAYWKASRLIEKSLVHTVPSGTWGVCVTSRWPFFIQWGPRLGSRVTHSRYSSTDREMKVKKVTLKHEKMAQCELRQF